MHALRDNEGSAAAADSEHGIDVAAGRHKPGERLSHCRHRLAAIGAAQKMRASGMMGGDLAAHNLPTVELVLQGISTTLKMTRAQFPNTDEALFPNQFVNISLLVDTVKNATVIPTSAVQRGAPGTFVYVVNQVDEAALAVLDVWASDHGYMKIIPNLLGF